jgi:predicted DNA-binding antitoxin AbrB/MazE fold protein
MNSFEAEYTDGVLRPVRPLRLLPGERVQVLIKRQPDPKRWNFDRLAKTGAEDSELARAGLGDWAESLGEEDDR